MSVASKSTIEQRALRIPVGPAMLDADLSLPASASGLVLFAHGSGSSRLSPRNRHVARVLNEAALATLLVDLLTPEEEAIDARTAHLRFDISLLAQRLVRRVCVDCKEDYHPEKEEFEEIVHAYGEADFRTLGVKYDDDFTLYRGKGCHSCNNSGYRGRAGIHELLVASDTMKKLIQSKARVAEMVKVAKEEGMTTLVQDGVQKVFEGLTDLKQVKAVAIK